MRIALSAKGIDDAPEGYLRVRVTEDAKGTKRLVREEGREWLEIGGGKPADRSLRVAVVLARSVVRGARANKATRVAVDFGPGSPLRSALGEDASRAAQLLAENALMASLEFRAFKTKPKEGWKEVRELLLCGDASAQARAGAARGTIIGEAVNACRELSNAPGGSLTPQGLADAAKRAVEGLPVTVKTLNSAAVAKAGMGLLAGVGAGSANGPTFTVLAYAGGKPKDKPLVLAGKGITFDAGGLNLKGSPHIYEMHMDMSGGAAVIHAVAAAARLKAKRNVIGLVPAAENLVGANALRPGDILASLAGKTVEVTDTDAEGRLVLADAIAYAKRFDPAAVLDVATLTGAALVALGHHASGLMTRDDALADSLLALGERSGDYLWRLPLWDEYEGIVKSEFADLQNHSISQGRYGGATNGAMFLWQFAKELGCPWAHLDIAPRMTAAPGEELAKGAAGAPVRLLVDFIESWTANA